MRKYDLLVFGATGFTGQLVAAEICAQGGVNAVALVGRNAMKLARLVAQLRAQFPRIPELVTLVADSSDPQTKLVAVCEQAKVVIACAGPFAQVGMPIVDACVQARTHYVDITGEFTFVRAVVEKHHAAATTAGVFVVPCAGFDCVASDLSNFFTHQQCASGSVKAVDAAISLKGGASRGTFESIAHLVRTATKNDLHPLCLIPKDARRGRLLPPPKLTANGGAVAWHPGFHRYRGPFVMAPVNERVVRRADFLEGRNVAYCEMTLGTWHQQQRSRLVMLALAMARTRLGLALLRRCVFPPEGGGPSASQRAAGGFRVQTLAYDNPAGSASPLAKIVGRCLVEFERDAYTFTAVAVVQVALALANGEVRPNVAGGVLTASTAVGPALLRRLTKQGVKFVSKL
jgi:short subunit dehydrogenase-like uncharacterized protein